MDSQKGIDAGTIILWFLRELGDCPTSASGRCTRTSQHHLALLHWFMKKLDLLIPLLEETLKVRKAILDSDHPDTLGTQCDLGVNYCDAGRLADAIRLVEEVHPKDPTLTPSPGDARQRLADSLPAGREDDGSDRPGDGGSTVRAPVVSRR